MYPAWFLVFTCTFILPCVLCQNPLKFIALGDWGEQFFDGQREVADGMAVWADSNNPEFIISTGDNFYPWGIAEVNHSKVDELWRFMYNHTSLKDLEWYLVVGNHDYGLEMGEEWVQVELSTVEPRWVMPHLWFSFHRQIGGKDIHFILIDTETYRKQVNNHTEMLAWFEAELSESTSHWKIVVAHRQMYSAGNVGINSDNINIIKPLLERYNVDVYLCGHDHNLQWLQKIDRQPHDVEYVLSGGGGALPRELNTDVENELNVTHGIETTFFYGDFGFTTFTVTETSMTVQYWDRFANFLYEFTRNKE